jgi:hypothetical protein
MNDEGHPRRSAADDSWSTLTGVANESEATLLAGFLEAHGIPSRVVDRSFHQTPTGTDDLSPIAVAVPTARLADAEAALAKRDKAFDASPEGSSSLLTDEGLEEVETSDDGGKR